MLHPLGDLQAPVSSPFGPRWGTVHRGIDFAVPVGTPLFAPADGVVVEGRERTRPVEGFGSWIWLDCKDSAGFDFIYGHVQGAGIQVERGERVRAGQLVGFSGNEGESTGPHLHFEAWTAPGRVGGQAVNPAPLFAARAYTEDEEQERMAKTVIDTAEGFPTPSAIRAAGHSGHVVYISPDRTGGGLPGKPVTRAHVDGLRAAGLDIGVCWQFGKDSASAPPDVLRGAAGGRADARAADKKLRELGLDGWPVFFAVDFDIDINQWNTTAVHYFRAAAEVLGRDRVGIYGHSKVCHWAGPEDKVIAEVAPGRFLAWQTRSWSAGVLGRDYAVLYQRIVDTPSSPGPRVGGITVDVNDIWAEYWGQRFSTSGGQTMKPNPNWRGDPTWLPEALRLWGVEVREMDGWKNRGQGDFTDIQGVMVHHTGAANTSPEIIAFGHSALRGLLSQIHLDPKGVATMCGVGIAYHAGEADPGRGGPAGQGYVTRPSVSGPKTYTSGNARYIGIEAQHSGNPRDPWPEAQMEAYARCCAAISWFLGYGTDRVIGHKEYAPSRKVDPSFQMEGFRRRVQWLLDNPPAAVRGHDVPAPPTGEGASPKEENMLDQTIPSRINPDVHLRVSDLLAILDEQGWKAERVLGALHANQVAIHTNQAMLLHALDLPVMDLPVVDIEGYVDGLVEADRAGGEEQ